MVSSIKTIVVEIHKDDYKILAGENTDISKIAYFFFRNFASKVNTDISLITELKYLNEMLLVERAVKPSDVSNHRNLERLIKEKETEVELHLQALHVINLLQKLDLLLQKHGPNIEVINKAGSKIIKELKDYDFAFDLEFYINNRMLEDVAKENPLVVFMKNNKMYKRVKFKPI